MYIYLRVWSVWRDRLDWLWPHVVCVRDSCRISSSDGRAGWPRCVEFKNHNSASLVYNIYIYIYIESKQCPRKKVAWTIVITTHYRLTTDSKKYSTQMTKNIPRDQCSSCILHTSRSWFLSFIQTSVIYSRILSVCLLISTASRHSEHASDLAKQ